ncbi:uncharacterized protein [Montipora foliosa]|uniref:uncharacterized protein n=1 Tax=Montipora foliosa TaxID=591990 RepID=UPI0035F2138B
MLRERVYSAVFFVTTIESTTNFEFLILIKMFGIVRNEDIVTVDEDDSKGKSNEQRTPELFETECSVQHRKQSDFSRSSASLSVKSSSSNSVSSQKSSMSKCGSQRQSPGRSTPDTETVIDIQEDFKFHMSDDIQKCNTESKYLDENILRRFIRDAAACLQGLVGSESISHSDFIIAATKICDTLPILRDPRPASFPQAKKFPYWKRIQNQHGYQKRKTKGKGQAIHEDKELSNDELEELNALLLKEIKAKKPNKEAIREMQVARFTSRSSHIDKLATDKTVLSEISSSYPFFAIHECTLVNELELRCKKIGAESTSVSDFLKNLGGNIP